MDAKAVMKAAHEFAREHLRECCTEIREWQKTALLRNGRVRELGDMLKPIDNSAHLRIAESIVQAEAFDHIAALTPKDFR